MREDAGNLSSVLHYFLVEGPSDKAAMEALLPPLISEKS